MRNKFTIAIFAAMLLLAANGLRAQTGNVAYVSRDSIMKTLPGYLEKIKEVEEMNKTYSEELKTKRTTLDQRLSTLVQPYNIKQGEDEKQIVARMSKSDTTALGMLRQEGDLLKATEKLYATKVKSAYEQQVKPLDEKIIATIKRYAVRNKLDMIYFIEDIAPTLAYVNTKKSATAAIVKELAAK